MRAGVCLSMAVVALALGACGGPQTRAVPAGPPVEVKFTRLANAEFGSAYVGQRVHSYAGFNMLRPSLADMPERYKAGWVGGILFAAEADGSCDQSKVVAIGDVAVLAPSSIAADWADAKLGSIFELVAVVRASETRTLAGGSARSLIIEVESMKPVGACGSGPETGTPTSAE